jgi:Protein of unknown function (DUF1353)
VPPNFETDFASVPRVFVWFLPRYGRYTKAAILHDYLCDEAKAGRMKRSDADGLFRRAMMELEVAFLRRWIMWAAVRVGGGVQQLLRPGLWQLLLVGVPALALVAAPAVLILAALALFWLIELVFYAGLKVFSGRTPPNERKPVNPPGLLLKTS